MWFELVLNGIGGQTLAQAKMTMTRHEFNFWRAYREKRGSLNFGRRLQQELAQLHYSYLLAKGVKDLDVSDLMPYEDAPSEIDEINKIFGL